MTLFKQAGEVLPGKWVHRVHARTVAVLQKPAVHHKHAVQAGNTPSCIANTAMATLARILLRDRRRDGLSHRIAMNPLPDGRQRVDRVGRPTPDC